MNERNDPSGVTAGKAPEAPPARSGERRRVPTALILVVVVVLVAAISGGVLVARGGGRKAFALKPGEIFVEPAGSVGPDSYSGEVFGQPLAVGGVTSTSTTATTATSTTGAPVSTTTTPTSSTAPRPNGATVVVAEYGGQPGLYGGTRNQSRCDAQQMLRFLSANPAKAQAWVDAQNADPTLRWNGPVPLRVSDLPAYFAQLTPVHLTHDTRVTNNGFFDGHPTPRQSVLQAGTAVLVDQYGVPRARCACGNPLTPPQPVPVRPTYVGTPWPGFQPANVVVVEHNPTIINVFVLVDVNTGQRFERPVGPSGAPDTPSTTTSTSTTTTTTIPLPPGVVLGEGDVQVTLQWVGDSDMDLHVVDPSGFEISYTNKQAPSGGALDHDEIPGCSSGDRPHVENVFWPTNGAPAGQYRAAVNQFDACGHAQSYVLIVRVRGAVVQNLTGTLTDNQSSSPVPFTT